MGLINKTEPTGELIAKVQDLTAENQELRERISDLEHQCQMLAALEKQGLEWKSEAERLKDRENDLMAELDDAQHDLVLLTKKAESAENRVNELEKAIALDDFGERLARAGKMAETFIRQQEEQEERRKQSQNSSDSTNWFMVGVVLAVAVLLLVGPQAVLCWRLWSLPDIKADMKGYNDGIRKAISNVYNLVERK